MSNFNINHLLPIGDAGATLIKVAMADYLGKSLAKTATSVKLVGKALKARLALAKGPKEVKAVKTWYTEMLKAKKLRGAHTAKVEKMTTTLRGKPRKKYTSGQKAALETELKTYETTNIGRKKTIGQVEKKMVKERKKNPYKYFKGTSDKQGQYGMSVGEQGVWYKDQRALAGIAGGMGAGLLGSAALRRE